MFEKLHSDKLFAKRKKFFFGKTLVKYLGHIVKAGSLRANPYKVEAIHMWPKPTTVKRAIVIIPSCKLLCLVYQALG